MNIGPVPTVLLANAKKEAAEEGCKMYVGLVNGKISVTTEQPIEGCIMYEVYPGGRVVDWSLTFMPFGAKP